MEIFSLRQPCGHFRALYFFLRLHFSPTARFSSDEARRTPTPALLVAPPVSQFFCMGEVLFFSRGLLVLE